jgi:hypothetical protein
MVTSHLIMKGRCIVVCVLNTFLISVYLKSISQSNRSKQQLCLCTRYAIICLLQIINLCLFLSFELVMHDQESHYVKFWLIPIILLQKFLVPATFFKCSLVFSKICPCALTLQYIFISDPCNVIKYFKYLLFATDIKILQAVNLLVTAHTVSLIL